jgi:mediator of RNA polymerase II transcription subunit 18
MSSHLYEVALFGEFFSRDLKAILNRITLHSESSHPIRTREIVFEPLDSQHQRDIGTDPVILRAKKELTEPDSGWYVALV